eukprot:11625167-Alexandrium_andersonii.AAC.1
MCVCAFACGRVFAWSVALAQGRHRVCSAGALPGSRRALPSPGGLGRPEGLALPGCFSSELRWPWACPRRRLRQL